MRGAQMDWLSNSPAVADLRAIPLKFGHILKRETENKDGRKIIVVVVTNIDGFLLPTV